MGASLADNLSGSAYVFRGLDTATETVTESVKLLAYARSFSDRFGHSVSLSGDTGLVGAPETAITSSQAFGPGSAYLFRGLDAARGVVTESVTLTASDGSFGGFLNSGDMFGDSVSLSGDTGLVGAPGNNNSAAFAGAAYVFLRLDNASRVTTESVKLTASDGATFDALGSSVTVQDDRFILGASGANSAYTGTISSVTTFDFGNTSTIIDSISFASRTDWIVGQNTSNNHLRLTDGDSARVLSAGKAVMVGTDAGSNENTLTIAGRLEANNVFVGDEGNFGNQLIFESTATQRIREITLFVDNQLLLEGDFTTFEMLNSQLGATDLFYSNGEVTELITAANVDDLLTIDFNSETGFTRITAFSPVLLGDVNSDQTVDFLDISPFIALLSAGEFQAEADVDQNGEVDFLDITAFISVLFSP